MTLTTTLATSLAGDLCCYLYMWPLSSFRVPLGSMANR